MILRPQGSSSSAVAFLGEAPCPRDFRDGLMMSGTEAYTLADLARKAGILLDGCYRTLAARTRPPRGFNPSFFEAKKGKAIAKGYEWFEGRYAHPELIAFIPQVREELNSIGCNVLVTLGDIGLWVATGMKSVAKHRGSMLTSTDFGYTREFKIIPTYSPEELKKRWDWSYIVIQDLRRVKNESASPKYNRPQRNYIIRPSFQQTMETLQMLIDRARGESDGI